MSARSILGSLLVPVTIALIIGLALTFSPVRSQNYDPSDVGLIDLQAGDQFLYEVSESIFERSNLTTINIEPRIELFEVIAIEEEQTIVVNATIFGPNSVTPRDFVDEIRWNLGKPMLGAEQTEEADTTLLTNRNWSSIFSYFGARFNLINVPGLYGYENGNVTVDIQIHDPADETLYFIERTFYHHQALNYTEKLTEFVVAFHETTGITLFTSVRDVSYVENSTQVAIDSEWMRRHLQSFIGDVGYQLIWEQDVADQRFATATVTLQTSDPTSSGSVITGGPYPSESIDSESLPTQNPHTASFGSETSVASSFMLLPVPLYPIVLRLAKKGNRSIGLNKLTTSLSD